ncbi:MAG: hypothetical protein HUU14_10595 [Dehalococcoidia bacterium]|nr:hypothetical protein [Dehalococcoidia bacterium]NUQ56322.1 hypothetical protein [Dehalococcoidia bacterium]
MTALERGPVRGWPGWLAALFIVFRGASGLFLHGLLRPGAPASLSRATGKVARR